VGGEPAYSGQVTWCRFVICSRTPGHPDVGQSVNKLALVYKTQGRYPKAEPLYKRAFAIELGSRAVSHKAASPSAEPRWIFLDCPPAHMVVASCALWTPKTQTVGCPRKVNFSSQLSNRLLYPRRRRRVRIGCPADNRIEHLGHLELGGDAVHICPLIRPGAPVREKFSLLCRI